MLLGGIAVGMWAEPRATLDIDLLISVPEQDLEKLKKLLQAKGFVVFSNPLSQLKRVKIFRFFIKNSDEDLLMVDAILADDEFKKNALSQSQQVIVHETPVQVAAIEDLILFKLLSGRPQDVVDIENLLNIHKNTLDQDYLIFWGKKIGVEDDLRSLSKKFS